MVRGGEMVGGGVYEVWGRGGGRVSESASVLVGRGAPPGWSRLKQRMTGNRDVYENKQTNKQTNKQKEMLLFRFLADDKRTMAVTVTSG